MSSSGGMVTLRSRDQEDFQVDEAVASQSLTIKHMIEDFSADDPVPLPLVTAKTLAMVIEYCKKHVNPASDEELKNFDAEFVKVDQSTLFDLVLAANYLNIKGLLDLTCKKVAEMIRGKTAEELRIIFNIENDFTPEEEEIVRMENAWVIDW